MLTTKEEYLNALKKMGEKYTPNKTATKDCIVKMYSNKKLYKSCFMIFGAGFESPEQEIKLWSNVQLIWLKSIDSLINPRIEVYDEDNNLLYECKLVENKLS